MEPLAQWDPVRSVWVSLERQLCGHSDVFSETWPSSGMTRRGRAYALPTLEPPTDDSECSCSPGLPTPTSRDWKGQNQRRDTSCLPGALSDL
jgi:hypothetical protein